MALSTRAIKRLATQLMTDSKMASLLAKCRNNEPWVTLMCLAMAAVVISLGFCCAASSITASTVTARRSSAGRYLLAGCITKPKKKVIDYYLCEDWLCIQLKKAGRW